MKMQGPVIAGSALALALAGFALADEKAADAKPTADQTTADKPAATSPDLGGHWKLNPELSDDARAKMREAREQGGGGSSGGGGMGGGGGRWGGGGRGGGMGGRGGGYGGHGGGYGGHGSNGSGGSGSSDSSSSMHALFEAPTEMSITPTDAEVVIMEKDGRLRRIHADGKKYKAEGGNTETKARWDAGKLVVETKSAAGGKVDETYEVAPDKSKLTVTLRVEGSRMARLTVKRVYDRAEGSSS